MKKVLDVREFKIRKSRFVYENIIEYFIYGKDFQLNMQFGNQKSIFKIVMKNLKNSRKRQFKKYLNFLTRNRKNS